MYLSIGKSTVIRDGDIVGIFDLDICSQSHLTREFLSAAERRGRVVNAADDLPNSFLLCSERSRRRTAEETKVYLSQSNSRTLEKRINQLQTERRDIWRKSTN